MRILVLNAGSSSLKFQFLDTATEEVLAKGNCERIGINGSFIKYSSDKGSEKFEASMPTHAQAIEQMLKFLLDGKIGVLSSLDDIEGIGHRMVNGGEKFIKSMLVTNDILKELEKIIPMAPLHNPAAIYGMRACLEMLPKVKNVVVFDTSFHSTMPDVAYMYALPYEMYEKHHVRRYGAHGTSHRFIANETGKLIGGLEGKKIVSCHLGNGSSITAIKDGKSVDTSMGYTPLAGVPMGTRCGDIDPSLVQTICEITGKNVEQATTFMNKECGLLGITGFTSDMRDIEQNLDNPRVKLALDMLCYSIKKYIGAYAAAMGGLDAIVFTGGIGENTVDLREKVVEGLDFLGVEIDKDINRTIPRGTTAEISTSNSSVKIFRIPTNEELMIALDTEQLIKA